MLMLNLISRACIAQPEHARPLSHFYYLYGRVLFFVQIEDGFIPKLLNLLDSDPEDAVRFKSLSAISCLVRDCPEGQEVFLQLNGCSVILRAIQTSKIRLRVKVRLICFSSRKKILSFFRNSMGRKDF